MGQARGLGHGPDLFDKWDGVEANKGGHEEVANQNDLNDDAHRAQRGQAGDAEVHDRALVNGQGSEARHDLAHVHDHAKEAQGCQGQKAEHDQRVAQHPSPCGRSSGSVEILAFHRGLVQGLLKIRQGLAIP